MAANPFTPFSAVTTINVGDSQAISLSLTSTSAPGALTLTNRTPNVITGTVNAPTSSGNVYTATGSITGTAPGTTVIDFFVGGFLFGSLTVVVVAVAPISAPGITLGTITGP